MSASDERNRVLWTFHDLMMSVVDAWAKSDPRGEFHREFETAQEDLVQSFIRLAVEHGIPDAAEKMKLAMLPS